jgi:flagellar biosynthesis protein
MKGEQRKKALALRYDSDYAAPEIVAKGAGLTAERIIAAAREYEVPRYEDPVLARLLWDLELGAEIPEELFEAVAEVLVFIYRAEKDVL